MMHLFREGNMCAHWMMSKAKELGVNLCDMDFAPIEFTSLISDDAKGKEHVRDITY